MKTRLVIIAILLLILTHCFPLHAQSAAFRLDVYAKTLDVQIAGGGLSGISGITFEPVGKTLYTVCDNGRVVYEIGLDGTYVREITLEGFNDVEGIAFQSGRYFLIAEEQRANIVRVEIPAEGAGPVQRTGGELLSIANNLGNTGVEDVAWCTSQGTAYAVTEKNPKTLYRIACDESGVPLAAYADDPFSIEDTPDDAAGLFVCSDGTFIVCNQEENRLIRYSTQGERLSELFLGMTQPEGVTIDEETGVMYVAGEPGQLCVFEVDKTASTGNAFPVVKKTNVGFGTSKETSSDRVLFTLLGRHSGRGNSMSPGGQHGRTVASGLYLDRNSSGHVTVGR